MMLLLVAWAVMVGTAQADPLRVQGSTTVNPIVTEALEILARENGLSFRIDTLGGSAGGIRSAAAGTADVGMASKWPDERDSQTYPKGDLHTTVIGMDAVALVVSPDVWESGVRALSRDQVRQIYENPGLRWSVFGGPDRRIVFFKKEPGRGTWAVFAEWVYGSPDAAPPVSHPEVGANEEVRTKVSRTRGALSHLSVSWADDETVYALGIRDESGEVIAPAGQVLTNGRYPLSRPLLLVTNGEPSGPARVLPEFLLGPRGQELVRKHGYLGREEAGL